MYYFPTGEVFSEEYYVDGNLEGELKNYYKNGKVLEHTQYQGGKLHGFSKKYSDAGILIAEVTFKNGVLNGPGKYYELNGDLREEGMYRDGKRYGKWEFYIGGYQPAQKWITDRKGRTLDFSDVKHYMKIIVALTETDRIMKEIDRLKKF